MTAHAVVRIAGHVPADRGEPVGDYDQFVDSIGVNSAQRSQRKLAARRFLQRHPDIRAWMQRPTAARLGDLHRLEAWPFLTWLLIDGRVRADLELLLAKPGGVDLGHWWTIAHAERRRRRPPDRHPLGVERELDPAGPAPHGAGVVPLARQDDR